jgi:hypothetical protein
MREIPIRSQKRKELKADLLASLRERSMAEPGVEPGTLMGQPSDIAKEFLANAGSQTNGFEYRSKTELFSWPLIHINFKHRGRAKGIIAVGTVSVGVLSVGVVSVGFVSLGAFGIGLFAAFGAMAFSGIVSVGAVATSIGMSIGAVATARYYAIGAMANAQIAVGSVARGVVALYTDSGQGNFTIELPANRDEIQNVIRVAFPQLTEYWLGFVSRILK